MNIRRLRRTASTDAFRVVDDSKRVYCRRDDEDQAEGDAIQLAATHPGRAPFWVIAPDNRVVASAGDQPG